MRREITGQAIDIKRMKGKEVFGIYRGSKQIKTKIGDQVVYDFTDDIGAPFGVYGFSDLNRKLQGVKPGTMVWVTYLGTELSDTKFGKKDVHRVKVEVDIEDGDVEGEPQEDIAF